MPEERRILDPFRDSLNMGDREIEIGLRCAKCKELVKSGEEHTCKEKTDESKDQDKTE